MTAPLGAQLNRRWHHLDRMGNLDCVTYEDDGFPVEGTAYAYDAWGLPRQSAENWGDDGAYNQDTFVWPDESTDRGYTNHEMLETIGLIHMNARLYDPIIGQFISPDSVTPAPMSAQDISRYAYVYNNPFRYIDPSGHSSVSIDYSGQKSLDAVIVKNDDGSFTVQMGEEDAANLSDEDKAELKAAFEKADLAAVQNHGTTLYALVKDSATSSSDLSLQQSNSGDTVSSTSSSVPSGAEMGAVAQAAPESSAKQNAPQETEAAEKVDPTAQGGDGGGSRLGNALRRIPIVGFALGSVGDIVSGQIGHGVSSFVNTLTADIGATVVGAFGKVYVTGRDIYRMGSALFSGNLGAFGRSVVKFTHDLIVPTYGWYGGAGWGAEQDNIWGFRNPFNAVDANSQIHDGSGGNHLGWVVDNWRDLGTVGPVASAYTLLGTIPFAVGDFITDDGKP